MTAPASRGTRNAPVAVTVVLVVAAIVLAIIAGIYFADSAGSLPSFFPGHQAGSSHHHAKHGIAAAVLALLALAGAWFTTGRRSDAAA